MESERTNLTNFEIMLSMCAQPDCKAISEKITYYDENNRAKYPSERGEWIKPVDSRYSELEKKHEGRVSHGYCPSCGEKVLEDLTKELDNL